MFFLQIQQLVWLTVIFHKYTITKCTKFGACIITILRGFRSTSLYFEVSDFPGSTVSFKPAPTAIQGEIDKLKRKGVNIIIGLGHYGYGRDQKLATAVDGLDVIVGGHSHTFIYSGNS